MSRFNNKMEIEIWASKERIEAEFEFVKWLEEVPIETWPAESKGKVAGDVQVPANEPIIIIV